LPLQALTLCAKSGYEQLQQDQFELRLVALAMPKDAPTKNLNRQHQREPTPVEGWHQLAGEHEAQEQRRKLARVRVPIDDYSAWMRLGSNGFTG
jgi:hypothetical protein